MTTKWAPGSIFAFPLADGSFGYGQVVADKRISERMRRPYCALLERRTAAIDDVAACTGARVLAIADSFQTKFGRRRWRVIGSLPLLVPTGEVDTESGKSWDGLEVIANAWFGLAPWNAFYEDDFLDKRLRASVTRPAAALVLGRRELEALGVQRAEWR